MQKGPSEIAVVQISRTEYITKCYHNMVDQIPQKRILRPRNQWESNCLHRRPHIWNSRTSGASRHHGAHEGTPAWTKAKPSSSGRSHLKTYRPVQVRIYTICVELAIVVRKDSVPQKFSFETHHMIDDVVAVVKRWRHSGAVRLTRSGSRKKLPRARSRLGVEATAILANKITWWHGNVDGDWSRLSFNLLLISRILVGTNGNGPRDRPARRDNTLGSWCQQHTPIHD